jgi:hypothetical protein
MWSCRRISLRTAHGVAHILNGEGDWDDLTTVNPHGDNLAIVFSDDALPDWLGSPDDYPDPR